jgi:DNA-directed RNA polymerase subunit E"
MAKKKKVCKVCGRLTEENKCPICPSSQLLEKYKGTAVILDAKRSEIAEKLEIKDNGEYALKY